MRALGCTAPHPTDENMYRLGWTGLYMLDVRAVVDELDRESAPLRAS